MFKKNDKDEPIKRMDCYSEMLVRQFMKDNNIPYRVRAWAHKFLDFTASSARRDEFGNMDYSVELKTAEALGVIDLACVTIGVSLAVQHALSPGVHFVCYFSYAEWKQEEQKKIEEDELWVRVATGATGTGKVWKELSTKEGGDEYLLLHGRRT